MHAQPPSLPATRRVACALLAPAGASCAAPVMACTGAEPGATTNLVIDAWDDTTPDVLIGGWTNSGNSNYLTGCRNSDVVPITATSSMSTLQYVRSVVREGETYKAFQVRGRPTSPLLVFRYLTGNGTKFITKPLDVGTPLNEPGTRTLGTSFRWSVTQVAALSLGGEMGGLPTTSLGSITYRAAKYPSLLKTESFSVSATLRTKVCTLEAAAVTLQDVHVLDLPAADSTTGERDFDVAMTCNGAYPVSLTLTDANAPVSTRTWLSPTHNATATGVHVQLLNGGVPVVLGQAWMLPMSASGKQVVPLAARYYRETGAIAAGVMEGQAVITATYR